MITLHFGKLIRYLLIAAIALLAVNVNPGSAQKLSLQPLPAPATDPTDMGTAFTYQGRLMDGASPANGSYDFIFELYDDAASGTLLGSDTLDDYTVVNGLFMTELDFGAGVFQGYERWLAIGVRTGSMEGSDPYTNLSPRQPINPTPYATFAGTIYRKTIVIKPAIPDNPLLNGQALLDAMAGIADATDNFPYLIKLEPGRYDLGTDGFGNSRSLTLVSYVDLEGSGMRNTIISTGGFDYCGQGTATAYYNSGIELRDLTLESDSGGVKTCSLSLNSYSSSIRLTRVRLLSENGTSDSIGLGLSGEGSAILNGLEIEARSFALSANTHGIMNENVDLEINASKISAEYGHNNFGVGLYGSSRLTMVDTQVKAVAAGSDTRNSIGVYSQSGYDIASTIRDSQIAAISNGYADTFAYGIWIIAPNGFNIYDSSIEARHGLYETIGIKTASAVLNLTGVKIFSYADPGRVYGLTTADSPITINNSKITASYGTANQGIFISDTRGYTYVINQTTIQALNSSAPAEGGPNYNIGIYDLGHNRLFLYRDMIEVTPYLPGSPAVGGTGIWTYDTQVVMENSTINSPGNESFVGIKHVFNSGSGRNFYINNSEIYACFSEDACHTIYTHRESGPILGAVVHVGASLLWGGAVYPSDPQDPDWVDIACIWVYDENYDGFGWPTMPVPPAAFVNSSRVCP